MGSDKARASREERPDPSRLSIVLKSKAYLENVNGTERTLLVIIFELE